jgi:hypothetical protein
MIYVNKWEKEDGNKLTKKEYNLLSSSASKKNIPLEDYLYMYGIKNNNSIGELQDPLFNNAELTTWVIKEKEKFLFLTKWRYKLYFEEAKANGIKITDLLLEKGFSLWKDLYDQDITNWLHFSTASPLTRKQYIDVCNSVEKGTNITDHLREMGYKKISDKMRY